MAITLSGALRNIIYINMRVGENGFSQEEGRVTVEEIYNKAREQYFIYNELCEDVLRNIKVYDNRIEKVRVINHGSREGIMICLDYPKNSLGPEDCHGYVGIEKRQDGDFQGKYIFGNLKECTKEYLLPMKEQLERLNKYGEETPFAEWSSFNTVSNNYNVWVRDDYFSISFQSDILTFVDKNFILSRDYATDKIEIITNVFGGARLMKKYYEDSDQNEKKEQGSKLLLKKLKVDEELIPKHLK